MLNFLKFWLLLLIGMVIFLAMSGCDSSQESAPPPRPVIVTGTVPGIAVPKQTPQPTATETVQLAPSLLSPPASPVAGPRGEDPKESAPDGISPESPSLVPPLYREGSLYVAEGKIDPFAPLITTEKAETPPEKEVDDVPKRILTPLEKLDFSQMRLVAIVQKGKESIAMVEESGGSSKGYIIRLGTFMGKNGGTVVSIMDDRIVIEETLKNFKGERITRSQEMKLHKPENED